MQQIISATSFPYALDPCNFVNIYLYYLLYILLNIASVFSETSL